MNAVAAPDLTVTFQTLRLASRTVAPPDARTRASHLTALRDALLDAKGAIVDALQHDFGSRSPHETLLAEVFATVQAIDHARAHVAAWMRADTRRVNLTFLPARAEVLHQPLGVIGILGPWNYPVHLVLAPLVGALSAGNRVMIKPSEFTPATSGVLATLIAKAFRPDHVTVVLGGEETGVAFSKIPFDHLFFTGSTTVGRHVMRAAAENLTPVTLELGGKSPVIVCPDADLARSATRIANGKLFNAGQTCIAPDYALVPRNRRDAFVHAFRRAVSVMYPTFCDNRDYTGVSHPRHMSRLQSYLDDARAKGASIVEINPPGESFDGVQKLCPTLVLDPTDEMIVMRDEIFGPILPVVAYDTVDEAIAYVNDCPRPLALYVFTDDAKVADDVLNRTVSGGACVNDTVVHVAQDELPFGGVGPSGTGRYHGYEGFLTFSNARGVMRQTNASGTDLIRPPYGTVADTFLKVMLRR